MATVYHVVLTTSRIANATRVDQSGSDGGDVTAWDKTADFILGVQIDCEKGPLARAYKLQWRDVSDEGSFADVEATGEISHAAATDLTDGDDLLSAEKLCTGVPAGSDWQDGLESEGDNIEPDSGTYSLADEYYTEFQWALDCGSAEDGHEYEFQLCDVTEAAVIGLCPSSITMASAAETFYETLTAVAVGTAVLVSLSTRYRTLAATAVGQGVLTTARMYAQTLTGVATGVAALTRVPIYAVSLAATAVGQAVLTKLSTFYRTLAATATGAAAFQKTVSKTLASTAVGSAVVSTVFTACRTLSATAIGVAVMVPEKVAAGIARLLALLGVGA